MIWVLVAACAVASVPAGLRWLRVAQREHYLAPSTTRFAIRWWSAGPLNLTLAVIAVAGVVGSLWHPMIGLLVVAAQVGPLGLTLKGTTSPLAWTPRLRRLGWGAGALVALVYLLGALAGSALTVTLGLFALPALVDLALTILGPIERRIGDQWVEQAAARLRSSGARVVAITGSYGKTTTKGYAAHLLAGTKRVVASPASFNNRLGLARAVNEQLVPGTEVFIAEMGTYGPGEIAALCQWIQPEVAAIVAIGPVHLERFRSEDRIVAAKSEILDRARIGVIAVDNPLLANLANQRRGELELITVGAEMERVTIQDGSLLVDGAVVGQVPGSVMAIDLCVAVGICIALGVEAAAIAPRLEDLPRPEHRLTLEESGSGVRIIDDTYNSNPAGANAALDRLAEVANAGRTAVVTPGMVELGSRQDSENEGFARRAADEVDYLLIVGSTNRKSLLRGSANGSASVTVVATRDDAVTWVRENLAEGDTVLYENDLPDHYP